MTDFSIILPSKPRAVKEENLLGIYEIENLYPGYGHTLGNSLRRIILSSLPGCAITQIKIKGVEHEFSTLDGIKEDVITMILHLKQVRFRVTGETPQVVTINVKGAKTVTAKDIKAGGQVEILNPELYIAEITDKSTNLEIELVIERGLGFVVKEAHQKNKMEVGAIAVDAIFTPIRRVSYEVENMRVADNTNYNRLRIVIETDGSLTPREALNKSVETMVKQLEAIMDRPIETFKLEEKSEEKEALVKEIKEAKETEKEEAPAEFTDILKTRIDTLDFSARTLSALQNANIRTVGGIARKKKDDLLDIDGIGEKGIQEIKKVLSNFGISLKE